MKEEKIYNQINNLIEEKEINSKVRMLQDNSETILMYWKIGKLLVEAQGEKERAKYGENLIKKWGLRLSEKYGKNYSYRNLNLYRKFYITFPIVNALRSQLTWTHYKIILPLKNENERNYYINQVILNNLSSRELIKEIKNKAFDRLSYANKENIKLIESNNYSLSIEDMIKDPILIKIDKSISNLEEKIVHKYIIEMLENRFLELGVGFALIGHEYKIKIGNRTYKIDLLFFNIELNCYVVIEVKTKENNHKDIGQLEMYAEYINKKLKKINHRKTIGILLVEKENKLVIEYISNPNIYITSYELIS